ncbi:glycoside hydrolase [Trichophaea hybrida]|nr:glycoside hydrolase [Trichophaea hybrida]
MFISFDMACCGTWTVEKVAAWINTYKNFSAQLKIDGKPFVSTFEGPEFAASWKDVEALTGELYLVPTWTSLGPSGISKHFDKINGAFSWDAWSPNCSSKSNTSDTAYITALSGKPYMMGVSPFFYTNLPEYSKNWLWGPDTLWYDRWEQVLDILPEFVEIISWNDYGESHYISPLRSSAVVSGAKWYTSDIPHDALQFVLPYYIAAYKAGSRDTHIVNEGAVFWYRTTPKNAGSDGGTTVGPQGGISATEAVEDAVYVVTLSNTDTGGGGEG